MIGCMAWPKIVKMVFFSTEMQECDFLVNILKYKGLACFMKKQMFRVCWKPTHHLFGECYEANTKKSLKLSLSDTQKQNNQFNT